MKILIDANISWRLVKLLSNDEDFLNLSIQNGFPPKVILLRMGNQSTSNIAHILLKYKDEIEELASNPKSGVLEII